MKRKDCAYCIDLDEQGALCDHPLRLYCGEPIEARCSSMCADYERRISITEALSRIHDLEAKLAESEKYRTRYADMFIPLKSENNKLRELVTEAIRLMQARGPDCGLCKHYSKCWTGEAMDYSPSGCIICNDARELGIEVD